MRRGILFFSILFFLTLVTVVTLLYLPCFTYLYSFYVFCADLILLYLIFPYLYVYPFFSFCADKKKRSKRRPFRLSERRANPFAIPSKRNVERSSTRRCARQSKTTLTECALRISRYVALPFQITSLRLLIWGYKV